MKYSLSTKRRMHTAGFTLIEMLVSVSIFAIVMVVSVGTLIVLVTSANSAQVLQSISTNLSFALDSMSRNLRTGYDYYCTGNITTLPEGTKNCATGSGARGIIFTDSKTDTRMAYRFNDNNGKGILQQKIGSGDWKTLTSDEIIVKNASFFVDGATEGDSFQPIVRIMIEAEAADDGTTVAPFYLQTTIVQRSINY